VYNIYIENARAGFYVPSIGDVNPAFYLSVTSRFVPTIGKFFEGEL